MSITNLGELFFLLGIKVFIDLKLSCQICFWVSISVHKWTNNFEKHWTQWERAFALMIWRIDDFLEFKNWFSIMIFNKKNNSRKNDLCKRKKKPCHPQGINFLTYTFHTFFSGNISLLLILKFWSQSCYGFRFSSINLIFRKKRPLCKFVYIFPNISFLGDKYIWKMSVFQAKPYDNPILREVARHFYSLPLYIQNNLNCK